MTGEERARRAEKRRREKERWNTILAYYMMKQYAKEKAAETTEPFDLIPALTALVAVHGIVAKLFQRSARCRPRGGNRTYRRRKHRKYRYSMEVLLCR